MNLKKHIGLRPVATVAVMPSGSPLRIYRDVEGRLGVHADDISRLLGVMQMWVALDFFWVVEGRENAITLDSLVPWLAKGGEPAERRIDRSAMESTLAALRTVQ